jgi:integrase
MKDAMKESRARIETKLNRTAIDKLDFDELVKNKANPDKVREVIVWDTLSTRFGVRVCRSKKSYVCQKSINGKNVRVTIASIDEKTPEQARKIADEYIGRMATGENIRETLKKGEATKVALKSKEITLKKLFQKFRHFKVERGKIKDSTLREYERSISTKGVFSDWLDKPINDITGDMALNRHLKIKKDVIKNRKKNGLEVADSTGNAEANLTMRLLRSLFNFHKKQFKDSSGKPLLSYNPVEHITDMEAWFEVEPRQSQIEDHHYPKIYQELLDYERSKYSDFIFTLWLTGFRSVEAGGLQTKHIDFEAKTIFVPETKNGKSLKIPYCDFLEKVLRRRVKKAKNGYLFPAHNKEGHVKYARKAFQEISEAVGVEFTAHDLRREFSTVAESLDIPKKTRKSMMNHSEPSGDVTDRYVKVKVRRMRGALEDIEAEILNLWGVNNGKEK